MLVSHARQLGLASHVTVHALAYARVRHSNDTCCDSFSYMMLLPLVTYKTHIQQGACDPIVPAERAGAAYTRDSVCE